MTADDFKYERTKLFVNDTNEDFHLEHHITVVPEKLNEPDKRDSATFPLIIRTFPWNPKFEGLSFIIDKVNFLENDDDTASLEYQYSVLNNPNELDLAKNNEESRDTEDNELLDVFVGRLIERLLYDMMNDENFMESVIKTQKQEEATS